MKGATNKIELEVRGMTCDDCAHHVRHAISGVPGVESADVPSWQGASATVATDGSVSADDLSTAVAAAGAGGYRATAVTGNAQPDSGAEQPFTSSASGSRYDVVVIGTGGGGMGAAIKAAELGARVAIVEADTIGGTCVNRGCVPSKALIRAADAYYKAGHHDFKGIATKAEDVDWARVVQHKDELVNELRQHKYADVLQHYEKIDIHRGRARLLGDRQVQVDGDNSATLHADRIIIATGATSFIPPIDGIEGVEVLTSTTVMELEALPESLIVLGGRAVALELGQTFARLGSTVTIVQRSDRLLPDHDSELGSEVKRQFRREGVEVITGATAKHVRQRGGLVELTVEVVGKPRVLTAAKLLAATGVRAQTRDLGLEQAGVATDESGFIVVDDELRTSSPDIFAVGDVTTLPKLVYLAAASGGIAARNALTGGGTRLDMRGMAEVIFTDPEIARVGLSEQEARDAGHQVAVTALRLEHVPRAIVSRETHGGIKLIADENTDKLLGAHVAAASAGEMIQVAAMAIRFGITVTQLTQSMFPYLTQVEGIKLAAQTFNKDVTLLSCCAG